MSVNIRTVTVVSEGDLVEGEWYLITGRLQDGLNTQPQIFFLRKKIIFTEGRGIPCMVGDLAYWSNGKRYLHVKHDIPLADVNIPPHGFHDVHMEKITDSTIRKRLQEEQELLREAQSERSSSPRGWNPVSDKIYEPYL